MPTASQAAAAASTVCLAAAIAWLVISEFPVIDPGRPRAPLPTLRSLEASMPEIGPLESFAVNDQNPFIPYQLREKENDAIRNNGRPQPPRPAPAPVPEPVKPTLPRLKPPGADGPTVNAIIVAAADTSAIVTFPGETRSTSMRAGETVSGWTLVEVDGSNLARMRQESTGAVVNLVIPERPTAPSVEGAPEAKPGKKAKPDPKAGTKRNSATDKAGTPKKADRQPNTQVPAEQPEAGQESPPLAQPLPLPPGNRGPLRRKPDENRM